MPIDLLLALVSFAFVSTITPGPNNFMLMTSGANFGVRKTIPHMLGIAAGFAFMLIMVGLGVVAIFEAFPLVYDGLRIACLIYMLYLAWKIATSSGTTKVEEKGKPISFMQAALFQWVNPKAWAMALSAVSVYAPDQRPEAVLLVAAVFVVVNLPSVSTWAWLGSRMNRLISRPSHLRLFNSVMAVLLLLSVLPAVFE
ncbi:LysE family translocator [Kiloniella sp. b19]|uniref:LysE family translocator n=1 Tax=Kiloniella sp. GXU_MW_B19 TaxID=3141326 RepID=UPI0031D534C5